MSVKLPSQPKRLKVFHAFCELAPVAQQVIADLVFWLQNDKPRNRRELKASLNRLANCNTVRRGIGGAR